MDDWQNHRIDCKQALSEYVPVKLIYDSDIKFTDVKGHFFSIKKTTLKGKYHFVVKLLPILNTSMERPRWVVYVQNEKETLSAVIEDGPEFYNEVRSIIKEKGVMNYKGYFYAIFEEEKGLKINLTRIQPPEAW